MAILGKKKKVNLADLFGDTKTRRRQGGKIQFNVIIEHQIKQEVQRLAKICRIPASCFAEYCLQVGMHYINQTLTDDEKRKELESHLESRHLLNEKDKDEETIILLSENNSNWLLLNAAEYMLKDIKMLSQQSIVAFKSGNTKGFEEYQSQFHKKMVEFLNWVLETKRKETYRS